MAFGTRGAEDRQALIDYVDSLDVPDSWRKDADVIVLAKTLFERKDRPARGKAERKPVAKPAPEHDTEPKAIPGD